VIALLKERSFLLEATLLFLLVIILYSPALGGGFLVDDYYWLTVLERQPERFWDDLNLLDEARGPADVQQLKKQAYVPWWTSPDFKIAYFRPLPSWLHALDYRIWGAWAPGHHLTNVLLYALTSVLVLAWFRQISPTPGSAFLGAVLFAVAENHLLRVYYVSSRNELLVLLLIVACLSAHIAARQRQSVGFLVLSTLCYVMALFSKESAIGLPGLLFLYDRWVYLPQDFRTQIRRFGWHYAVLAAITLGYLAFYRVGAYGAKSLFFYSPSADGLTTYLFYAAPSVTLYLFNYAYGIPLWIQAEQLLEHPLLLALGIIGVFALAILVVLHLRRSPWLPIFALWLLLTLPLFASSHPSERVLYQLSPGASWLAAMTILAAWKAGRFRWLQRSGAALLVVGTLLVPLVVNRPFFRGMEVLQDTFSEQTLAAKDLASDPEIEEVVFLTLPHPWLAIWMNYYLQWTDRPTVRYDVLTTLDGARITVVDEHTLLLEADGGGFFRHPVERLFRTETTFSVGEEFQGAGFNARIERLENGVVRAIRFTFPTPLTDPRRAFIAFDGTQYRRFSQGS